MTLTQAKAMAAIAKHGPARAEYELYHSHRAVWDALKSPTPPTDPRQVEILDILREGFGGYPENLKK